MLSSAGDVKGFASNTNTPGTVVAMRNACHNILYGIVNSNAMDERNFSLPGWVKTIYAVDVVVGLAVVAMEAYAVLTWLKRRETDADSCPTEK